MKNLNTKTDGYYELRYNGEIISAYVKLISTGEKSYCVCCGKLCNNFFKTYHIDENDNEICMNFGISCFKKIAKFDDSILAL